MKLRSVIIIAGAGLLAVLPTIQANGIDPAATNRFIGGSYDGWDRYAMAQIGSLEPIPRGTIISIR